MDVGQEESCRELYLLLRRTSAVAVVHLAFVIDPVRTGVLDVDRMWQINVAGTARVMEAITEANRDVAVIEKFIFPSSVSAYGSGLTGLVTEDFPLGGHTLPYAIHKMESDRVVQQRAPSLRDAVFTCASAYLCGSQRTELFSWLVSRHAKRPQQSRATHARKRQAPPVHAAVWKRVFGESHTVRPCRRYGAANCFHLAEDRARSGKRLTI